MTPRFTTKTLATTALAGVFILGGAAAAQAHFSAEPSPNEPGVRSTVDFVLGHGCGELPTTRVTVQLPDEVQSVTPVAKAGWSITTVVEDDGADHDHTATDDDHASHSHSTGRISQVVFTADSPLPDGLRDTFQLVIALPDLPGESLYFPVLQECSEGAQVAWAQIPVPGTDPHSLDTPAPGFTIGSSGSGHGDDHGDSGGNGEAGNAGGGSAESGQSDVLGITGVALGAVALVLALVALLRPRKSA